MDKPMTAEEVFDKIVKLQNTDTFKNKTTKEDFVAIIRQYGEQIREECINVFW